MGALIKKTEARPGRHIFEASGPSLPFPNCQSGGGIARHCTLLPPQSSKLAGMCIFFGLLWVAGRRHGTCAGYVPANHSRASSLLVWIARMPFGR
jgi:hypothetical protein